jgi:hypothetical protein
MEVITDYGKLEKGACCNKIPLTGFLNFFIIIKVVKGSSPVRCLVQGGASKSINYYKYKIMSLLPDSKWLQ